VKILVVGSAIVDLIARPTARAASDTSNDAEIGWSAGGAGRNVAENLVRLGASVTFVTDVADDPLGRFLIDSLRQVSAEAAHGATASLDVRVCRSERTGIYLAILDADGGLDTGYCQTGTEAITLADIEAVLPDLATFDGAVIDANLNPTTIAGLADRCRVEGVPFALETVARERSRRVAAALPGCALIKPDRGEAEVLTGRPCVTADDAVGCANALVRQGAQQAIISLGPDGLVFADAKRHLALPPAPASVVDVTGAGDALFATAFLGLLRGMSQEQYLTAGLRAAALTCAWTGAVTPRLTRAIFES
jgi:pseudouridine kinase